MADKLLRALVTIPMDGLVPADYPTNTWYFDGDDGNADASYWSGAHTLLTTFYQAIDQGIFPQQVATSFNVKYYDMRDPTPRAPEFEDAIAITSTGDMLPAECAVCLSFQAQITSGLNQKRRRGRIFLGPIQSAVGTVVNSQVRVSSTARTLITGAAAALEDGIALATTGTLKWAVYSPTTHAESNIDDAFNDVTDGWVDDAFDTQRRRGPKPSTRTLFT